MAVIGLTVGAVAYIANEYFVPIGVMVEEVAKGGAAVLVTIAAMGAMVYAASKMDIKSIAIGSAAMAAVAGLVFLSSKAVDVWTDLCVKIYDVGIETFASGSAGIVVVLAGMSAMIAGLGALVMGPQALVLAAGAAAMAVLSGVIAAVSYSVGMFTDLVVKVNGNITEASVKKFKDAVTGKNGMASAIKDTVSGLSGVGLWASAKAAAIGAMLRPVFETLTMFMDIVVRLATM